MAITDFSNQYNFEKQVLVEIKPGIRFLFANWVTHSSSVFYQTTIVNGETNEIVKLQEDGIDLTKVSSIADCQTINKSWYYDWLNSILYVNPSDITSFIMGFTWLGFTNTQYADEIVGFIPQDATQPIYYKPFLDPASIPPIIQKVGEYYQGIITTQFGSLSFLNNGWWWENRNSYEWHNKDVFVKIGEKGSVYADFVNIYPGRIRKPVFRDDKVTMNVKDVRQGILKDIPTDRFDIVTYPNLDPDWENKSIPILVGTKTNISPAYVDTVNFIFKVSQTVFNGVLFAMQSISAVYKDGVALATPADYAVNLNTGEIDLVADPANTVITCDAEGIKCDVNFATGAFTGVFTENTADILYFILNVLNSIPIADINLADFSLLNTKRTQKIGYWLQESIRTLDFVKILQALAFQYMQNADGEHTVKYYDRDISAAAPLFRSDDYKRFEYIEDTESAFKNVVINYDMDPTTGAFKTITATEDETGYRHQQETTLEVETALTDDTEAGNLADFFIDLVSNPGEKVNMSGLPLYALEIIPSDKVLVSRSIRNEKNEGVEILDEVAFLVLQVNKNIQKGDATILALLDNQATGQGLHSDIPHTDGHVDSHADHTDDHADGAHLDTHTDVPHGDQHTDTPYEDSHGDVPHQDGYTDHIDGPHIDEHNDVPHFDEHEDTIVYIDSHTDSPYEDSYEDSVYGDYAFYTDEHTDEHDDIPHTDSEI